MSGRRLEHIALALATLLLFGCGGAPGPTPAPSADKAPANVPAASPTSANRPAATTAAPATVQPTVVTPPSAGGGKTYYVGPAGDDANPGTREQPWASPGQASRQLQPGDTLVVLGGRYVLSEYDHIIVPPSGREDAWITIKGEEGNRPVLAGRDDLMAAVDLSGASYIRLENLEITHDDRASGEDVFFREGIVGVDQPSSHLVLRDLYIHHLDEFGLDFGDVDQLEVSNCRIEYCGFGAIGGPEGQHGGWRNVRIEGSRLSYGGHYYQGGDGTNRAYDRPDGFGIEASEGPIEIVETVAEHNYGDGFDSKAANTTIRRSIVANNSCDGVKLWGDNSRIENTLIYGRGDGDPEPTPWAAIVIENEHPNAHVALVNVTVDDTVGGNYLMYVQYDQPSVPLQLTVRNSIFRGVGETSSIFLAPAVSPTFENNFFYIPRSEAVLEHGDTLYTPEDIGELGPGNRQGDPLFVAPAWGKEGDYHLQPGSPAIDAGSPTDAPAMDLEGKPRPQGDGFDIGAFEG